MEDPHADTDLQDEDVSKALAGNLNAFWAKQQRRQLERKYDVEGYVDEQDPTSLDPSSNASDGWQKVGGGAGSSTTGDKSTQKYVPPGAKAAGKSSGSGSLAALASRSGSGPSDSKSNDRDQNTIRVTNISEDTTESELQALFAPYGRISRVYLAKDKETLQSRGFAFVSFVHREDAARAMEALQGFGYDHLILKLEWARPSAPKDPGSEGTQYRSGYGKALAQDTKDKVSYASNLTK
jgi:translation initiation factor 3 subunit G